MKNKIILRKKLENGLRNEKEHVTFLKNTQWISA